MTNNQKSIPILSVAILNRLKSDYQMLSPQEQAALQFLAVIPYTEGYYKESALLEFAQIEKNLFGLKENHVDIKSLIKKLKKIQYLHKSNNITPELLNFLSIEAFKSKYLPSYMIAQSRTIEYMKIEQLRYKIRNAIYKNNFSEFCEARLAIPDSEFFSNYLPDIFYLPVDMSWFKNLDKNLQAAMLHEMILVKYLFFKSSFDEVINYYLSIRCEKGNEAIDQALAIQDIFQLDVSKNQQTVGYRDQFNFAAKCLLSTSTSQTSDEEFTKAIIYFKKLTKKRTFLLDLPYSILMMLSLMANGHRKNIELITTTIKNEQKVTRAVTLFRYFENILWYLQGFKARKPNAVDTNIERFFPFFAVFTALFMYWYEPKKLNIASLEVLFEKIEAVPLLGKIVAEILWRHTNQKRYQDYLNNPKFTDIIAFTDLISFEDSWSSTIDSLENFFQGNSQPSESKTKRLIWKFNVKSKEVSPLEQSLGVKGWTKGKVINLKRLATEHLDFVSNADQKIIATISTERSYYGQTYACNKIETLLALADHPNVYDANLGIKLELYVCEPELDIRQNGKDFLIKLSHSSEVEGVILEKVSESRYNMVHFKKALLPLLEIIGKGIKVPEKGKDRIISVIKKIGGQIPVHSDIETQDIKLIASDPRVIAQLTPLNSGLKLQFLVRPFSDHGPYFKVGHGRELVQVFENNEPLKTIRSFASELEIGNEIISHSVYLQNNDDGSFEWELDNPSDCLDVLGDLKQSPEDQIIIEWPQGEKFKISQTIDFKNFSLSIKQQRDWFSLDGSISFDNDTVMDLKTFMGLLGQAEGNFIKLDDQEYLKLTSSLKKQLHELSIIADHKHGDYRFNALSAHSLKHFTDQVSEVKSDESWKELIHLFAEAEKFTPSLPSTFEASLREYQEEGFDWLSRLAFMNMGACLADDMGLGKTVQALAVLLNKATHGPCIVVAPTSVCYNWHNEILKFAPTLSSFNLDSTNRVDVINSLGKMDVLICSYTLLQQEIDILKNKKWAMVVLDEAQAIKNSTTKRFQAAIQLEGEFKLALSGTPIENGIEEIWSIFKFIAPGLLGSKEAFQKRFLTAEKINDSRQALKNLIKPFILRRTKNAVLQELPPKTEQTLYIEMDPEEAAFYEALRQNAIENIASMDGKPGQRKLHILAEITKLRRACCHPKLVMPVNIQSSKLRAFIELTIELLANNHKALVFSQYVTYLDLVKQELDKHNITYQYLDGSTPANERQKRVNDFQEGKSSIFLLSLKAGGSGLNLTAADYVIHLDPWWNPAVEDQASDRIHRIGQQRPVTIYRLIMKSSIEEKILSMHHDKRALADDLLDGTNTASKLSEEDLIGLLGDSVAYVDGSQPTVCNIE